MGLSFKNFLISALFLSVFYGYSCIPEPSESYPNKVDLDDQEKFILYWLHDSNSITFELHLKDTNWFIFGLSSSEYSDVAVAWSYQDFTGHFSDRKLKLDKSNKTLSLTQDNSTDWIPLYANLVDEYVIFKFKRDIKLKCKTGNLAEDLDISTGLNSLIYSSSALSNGISISNDSDVFDKQIHNLNKIVFMKKDVELLKQTNYGPFKCQRSSNKPKTLNSKPTTTYPYSVDLVEGVYKFYWDYNNNDFTGEIHCKTDGWVGFGLSPNGDMAYSDVIVGWIDTAGKTNFSDRHINNKRQVLVDSQQDWHLLLAKKTNGITILKFTRKLKSCDPDDRDITVGSPNVIFSWGSEPLSPGENIYYHSSSNRGTKQLNLITGPSKNDMKTPEKNIELLDFQISNVIMPASRTYYYCKGFKVPKKLTQKRHILKWELILPEINKHKIHHVLVYECQSSFKGESQSTTGNCFANQAKSSMCLTISFGWAIGGDLVSIFPQNTGYPIGGDTDFSYFFIEIHYNDPDVEIGFIDNLILRYHVTKTLRKNELGVLSLGTGPDELSFAIPPGVESFELNTQCVKEATNKILDSRNYTFVMAFPHTHLAGTEIYTRHIRDGKDIGYVFKNDYYNFDFQKTYNLNPFVNFTKGDEFITTCRYKTTDRTGFTVGGFGTHDEMCFHFLTYYPRINFKACISVPYFEDVLILFNKLQQAGAITLPQTNDLFEATKSVYRQLNGTLTEEIKNEIIDFYKTTRYSALYPDFGGSNYVPGPFDKIIPTNNRTEIKTCEPDQVKSTKRPSATRRRKTKTKSNRKG